MGSPASEGRSALARRPGFGICHQGAIKAHSARNHMQSRAIKVQSKCNKFSIKSQSSRNQGHSATIRGTQRGSTRRPGHHAPLGDHKGFHTHHREALTGMRSGEIGGGPCSRLGGCRDLRRAGQPLARCASVLGGRGSSTAAAAEAVTARAPFTAVASAFTAVISGVARCLRCRRYLGSCCSFRRPFEAYGVMLLVG